MVVRSLRKRKVASSILAGSWALLFIYLFLQIATRDPRWDLSFRFFNSLHEQLAIPAGSWVSIFVILCTKLSRYLPKTNRKNYLFDIQSDGRLLTNTFFWVIYQKTLYFSKIRPHNTADRLQPVEKRENFVLDIRCSWTTVRSIPLPFTDARASPVIFFFLLFSSSLPLLSSSHRRRPALATQAHGRAGELP